MSRSSRLTSVIAGAVFAVLGSLVVVPFALGGCSSKSDASPAAVKCTPGNYVFCRCQDREEGTKLCNEDGASFGKCEPCETADNPAIPDDPYNPPPEVEVDGGDEDVKQPPGPGTCGDKAVQDGEDCDDGNKVEDDGCDSSCKLAGTNPLGTRSCPGLDTHVWSKPVTYAGTTLGSTNTGTAKPACPTASGTGSTAADRVFKVTAHKTGTMTAVLTDTNYDAFIYVSNMCVADNVAYIACSNKVTGVGGETLTFPVTAGTSYSLLVDGTGTVREGAFRVTFSIQ